MFPVSSVLLRGSVARAFIQPSSITSLKSTKVLSDSYLVSKCVPFSTKSSTMGSPHQSIDTVETVSDYRRFLNESATVRQPSLIRELTKKFATAEPGTIFMAGGFPNPDLFPFSSLSVQIDAETSLNISGQDLRASLQYQPTMGYPPLLLELKKVVDRNFNPPANYWDTSDLIVTVGSQNALHAVLAMVLSRGDPLAIQQPCYSSALSIMDPYFPSYIPLPDDDKGMQPQLLRAALKEWYEKNSATGRPADTPNRPKILYLNPTGGNPSGIVIPTERKKEIYKIAQEYDLLILEDDPYYFVHFLQQDPTTFLSMDVDGRVIRFDSFSKVLSSGLRVGFASGRKELIRALELFLQASILHASSLSQVLVHGVLRSWGHEGFVKHTKDVKEFYRKRRSIIVAAAEKHLSGLAEWVPPNGGMFLWLKTKGVDDTFNMIMENGLRNKIMATPGREFMVDKSKPCPFVRLSFSVVPEDQIEQGIMRLAELIKEEQARCKKMNN